MLRALAILVVVLGHWLTSAVTVTDGRLTGVNLLYVVPWAPQATWAFQVMPVFFLVGGYANTASLTSSLAAGRAPAVWVRARALRLLRPTAVLVVTLVAAHLLAGALGADPEVTRMAVWLPGIGLWFVVVYLAVVALTPAMVTAHRRWGLGVVGPMVLVVAAGDAARLATGLDAPAAASYVVGWLAVHQLGIAWRTGAFPGRRHAVALALGGGAAAVALVALGPYGTAMVGAVPAPGLSNSDPPTLALLALATMQAGLVLLLRPVIGPWLARPRPWVAVVAVNSVVLTIFLWHMVPVVVAGVALVGTGVFPDPAVGSGEWFAWRVPWFAVLTALLAVLVLALARVETATPRRIEGPVSGRVVAAGVVACATALAAIGTTANQGVLPLVPGLPVVELVLFTLGLAALARTGT
nr:acyltransferase [Cellulomonas sp. APG4]